MVSFESDYTTGAHPEILKRLSETNLECLPGYGTDRYCESAGEKIRLACGCPDADVEFLLGGTQTNAITIDAMLRDYEGVIAAETGHISTHEAGAIEHAGRKVLTLEGSSGKVLPKVLQDYLDTFYADDNHEHMVFPGMVYISHPTEYGTLYSKQELEELAEICHSNDMVLYMDGARLAYGLMSRQTDVTLEDIARCCDAFYIGGTKCGALCGEALVFCGSRRPAHFMNFKKKRGALLAKGRVTGVQFDTLFTDDLYYRIGSHAIDAAEQMKDIFRRHGYEFYLDSPTNQQFIILNDEQLQTLRETTAFSFWEKLPDGRTVVRFATSWSTTEADLKALEEVL
ncbi:MAG: low specificity L-threonine aldolase [Firmicutes bacterium]|nr:low specificity L-threonine aldolase [Bacillota bacterium]